MSDSLEDIVKRNQEYIPHPNRITAIGGGLSVCSIPILIFEPITGTAVYGLGAFCDYFDGKVARVLKQKTASGAKIDPLFDKIKNVTMNSYMIGSSLLISQNTIDSTVALSAFSLSIGANWAIDYYSQKQRGDILHQVEEAYTAILDPASCEKDFATKSVIRANRYGKWKTGLQIGATFGFLAGVMGYTYIPYGKEFIQQYHPALLSVLSTCLGVSAYLGFKGLQQRKKIVLNEK